LALYSTVLTKKTDAAALTAIVYICIAVDYPNLEAPVSLALHQVFDTLIGIAVAAYVNSFNMPRIKHPEYIFFVRLQDLVPDRYACVSGQVLVMLNRLYNEGARISLVSRWAPAFLLSQMGTMEINLPVIVMDGAALYDIGEKQYQYVKAIPKETAEKLEKLFLERNLGYCIYAVSESNMSVYRRGNLNDREEEDFQLMKRSPYRNYVSGEMAPDEQIAFIRLVDEDDRILELEEELTDLTPEDVRISTRKQPRVKGCSGLYFHHVDATIEKRKADLIRDLSSHGEHGLVPVDMVSEHSYRAEREALHMLSKLQDIYEPVSLLK
ncbi:MAG: HAD hydrolase family protein, partial [Clostridiales bacterium]|nr:HAD hydrolase family protein [Candidatus Blautia equi]